MRLAKFTHACVRLEDGERRLLIDPGVWTEPEAFDGVTDILITHEFGYENFDGWMEYKGATDYRRILVGDSITL